MDIYIDKENLLSFIKGCRNEYYDDCLRMLKRELHINFNFEKSVVDEGILGVWLSSILSQGRGNNENSDKYLNEKFPQRPIKSNFLSFLGEEKKKKLMSIYLINDNDARKLQEKGNVLVGILGEEEAILEKMFLRNYCYEKIVNIHDGFSSWNMLCESLPCTDIVLQDRYLLQGKYGEGRTSDEKDDIISENVSDIIRAFSKDVRGAINVIIFTCPAYDCDSNINKINNSDRTDRILNLTNNKIKIDLKKHTPKPNLTFVIIKPNEKLLHDRFIITNYRIVSSGDSFTMFATNDKKLKSNGTALRLCSLADRQNYELSQSVLNNLQNIVDNGGAEIKVIGDKKSNFIKL